METIIEFERIGYKCKTISSIQTIYKTKKEFSDNYTIEEALSGEEKVGYHYKFYLEDNIKYTSSIEITSLEKIIFKEDAKYEIKILIKELG
jgi:hypothetical protein